MDAAHRLGLSSSATMMFGHVETVPERIEHLERLRAQQDKSLARAATSSEPPRRPPPIARARASEDHPATGGNSVSFSKAAAVTDGADAGAGPGFTAFIAWTFQSENTKLRAPTAGASEYLRMQALSRIFLDNIPNVQSSWVTQGPDIGQVALKYGANDLGSIMIEENVVSQAGTTFRMNVEEMRRLIADLGYEPQQRDNWYRLVA
jgi:cyclic dehypoxanthinyl futalosine synthase